MQQHQDRFSQTSKTKPNRILPCYRKDPHGIRTRTWWLPVGTFPCLHVDSAWFQFGFLSCSDARERNVSLNKGYIAQNVSWVQLIFCAPVYSQCWVSSLSLATHSKGTDWAVSFEIMGLVTSTGANVNLKYPLLSIFPVLIAIDTACYPSSHESGSPLPSQPTEKQANK